MQRRILTIHIIAKIKRNTGDALSINVVKSARELLPSNIKSSEVSVKKCSMYLKIGQQYFITHTSYLYRMVDLLIKKLNLICLVQKRLVNSALKNS